MKAKYYILPRISRLKHLLSLRQKVIYQSTLNIQVDNELDSAAWSRWFSLRTKKKDVSVKYRKKTYIGKKDSTINYYIFANGSERNFYDIGIDKGFAASTGPIDIEVSCENFGTTVVEIGVIEFGANLSRINLIQKSDLKSFKYTPSKECRRYLPFIKISGTGQCVINAIFISKPADNTPLKDTKFIDDTVEESSQYSQYLKPVHSNITLEMAKKLSENIDSSTGVKLYKKQPYKVGIITDEYMFNYYKDVFDSVFYLTPDNYQTIMDKEDIDLILYVSCWKGIIDEEWRGIKYREKPQTALTNILRLSKENNIKTIFQTIEDPSNFEYFLPIAKQFDYVFTSDTDMISKYKDECGHDNVFYGEYGVNTKINNPIDSRKYIFNNPFFAGSYARRYTERCIDTDIIMDSILTSNIEPIIIDRNFNTDNPDLQFPEKYQSYLYSPVKHEELQKLHKLFRYNINLNSIKSSPTMCAMRVYELQAQCTNIISNYARSVLNNFPNIRILPTVQDLSFEFNEDPLQQLNEYRKANDASRYILSNKSAYRVVGNMLNQVGLKDVSDDIGYICVIYDNDELLPQINCQTVTNIKPVKLGELSDWEAYFNNEDIRYFTFFKSGNDYQKYYLEDLLNGFAYTEADFITVPDISNIKKVQDLLKSGHRYTDSYTSNFSTLFDAKVFSPEDVTKEKVNLESATGYEVSPFNFNEHIYTDLLKVSIEHEFSFSIIIPTHNNGEYLIHKCLPSLMRQASWPNIEVIIVDDASSDEATKNIITELARQYPNIVVEFLPSPASGSASRARNRGIEMATTEYIGFLDPDNEISSSGYDILYGLLTDKWNAGLDFVSGYHAKVHDQISSIGVHASNELNVIEDPVESFFKKGKFPVVATQPALIKKQFLVENNIKFIEGAAGQDTLFGWEVLFNAHKCGFTNNVHLIYYAQRNDSITNVISKSYFDKKLVLEKAQVKFLKNTGLLDLYKEHHFDNFMDNWYLPKAEVCEDKEYAYSIIDAIKREYS